MLRITAYSALFFLLFHLFNTHSSAINFLYNSFNPTDLILISDARVDSSIVRLTNDSDQSSIGRAFYPTPLKMITTPTNTNTITSFSTSFVFSILPQDPTNPGFGLAFVLSNTTSPSGAISGQYFGLFSNALPIHTPLLAVEFDTGQNQEFNDSDGNHVGIDLNSIQSSFNQTAGYWDSTGEFRTIHMNSGQNIRAWIEFSGTDLQINVTISPAGISKPSRPLISYQNPEIVNYLSDQMYVGFSASKVTWVERQRILGWSLSDMGGAARELNTSNLPVFLPDSPPRGSPSAGLISGTTIGSVVVMAVCLWGLYWFWYRKQRNKEELEADDDKIEEWELEYWPHRFSYEELWKATKGFSKEEMLGFGGFGRVYKGVLSSTTEIAVKCISHDSKQGVREFMAEISSMGRLQHKNLVNMKGWCRKGNELMLVYDYMPNGSLNNWIFDKPNTPEDQILGWDVRRRVLGDVAEGLLYLHHGWDQMVLHRDIKPGNILLDGEMRGRLGDFGLAKLYQHGEAPGKTRVVGTLGYLAPELAHVPAPTAASDVYSFGVVMLEVACGRRQIEGWLEEEDEVLLVDRVSELYVEGRVLEAVDERIRGECKVEEMEKVLKLGLACSHPDPNHRPTMKEVVAVLLGEEAVARLGSLVVDLGRIGSGAFDDPT
ncbi:L-type lectin-domain containing receptor kinase S.1-like [Tasmannia lanceolata]|uniref:L-type lectin-domain containing receptor kinase S.1-like n=1 Tax=Tasmannia lanceolata TaxID=3420 RepID=UPI004064B500